MWVVEATLKPGYRHEYARRVEYIDEDSWQMSISDRYDARGQLWRTALAFIATSPEVPLTGADGYEFVDLIQHRYLVQGLHSQETDGGRPITARPLTADDFTADALRRAGRR